jgi:hypothetical protein
LRKFGVGCETSLGERLDKQCLCWLRLRFVLHALDGTAFAELANDQGPQGIIGVANSPTTYISRFGKCTSRQGPDDAGKELNHHRTYPVASQTIAQLKAARYSSRRQPTSRDPETRRSVISKLQRGAISILRLHAVAA